MKCSECGRKDVELFRSGVAATTLVCWPCGVAQAFERLLARVGRKVAQ